MDNQQFPPPPLDPDDQQPPEAANQSDATSNSNFVYPANHDSDQQAAANPSADQALKPTDFNQQLSDTDNQQPTETINPPSPEPQTPEEAPATPNYAFASPGGEQDHAPAAADDLESQLAQAREEVSAAKSADQVESSSPETETARELNPELPATENPNQPSSQYNGFVLPTAPDNTELNDTQQKPQLTADMLFKDGGSPETPQIHTFKRRTAEPANNNDYNQPIASEPPSTATEASQEPATPDHVPDNPVAATNKPLEPSQQASPDMPVQLDTDLPTTKTETADAAALPTLESQALETSATDINPANQPAVNNQLQSDTNQEKQTPPPEKDGRSDYSTFEVPQMVQPAAAEALSSTSQQPAQVTRLDKEIKAEETASQVNGFTAKATEKIKRVNYKPIVSAALFGVLIFGIFNSQVILGQVQYLTTPSGGVSAPVDGVGTNIPVGDEDRILIPQINVDVPVVYDEPSFEESRVQKALERGVVHYGTTAMPGEIGNTVIVGHSSNNWWDSGQYKFAFILLDKLNNGDQIVLHYEGTRYVYEVERKFVVEPSDISVLQATDEPTLTLITCTPPGTSWQRLIVQATQVSPDPNENTSSSQELPQETMSLPSDSGSNFWNFMTGLFSR